MEDFIFFWTTIMSSLHFNNIHEMKSWSYKLIWKLRAPRQYSFFHNKIVRLWFSYCNYSRSYMSGSELSAFWHNNSGSPADVTDELKDRHPLGIKGHTMWVGSKVVTLLYKLTWGWIYTHLDTATKIHKYYIKQKGGKNRWLNWDNEYAHR